MRETVTLYGLLAYGPLRHSQGDGRFFCSRVFRTKAAARAHRGKFRTECYDPDPDSVVWTDLDPEYIRVDVLALQLDEDSP